MTIYTLIDKKRFLQGLPNVPELDDTTLTQSQRSLLATAVQIGIYAAPVAEKPVETPVEQVSVKKKNVEQPPKKD